MTARPTDLVLVPGLACTEDLFAIQIASLRGEVAISVADHARHDTMSAIARAVFATAPNRFALCGLSMGGYIAFEMVRQAPDRIELPDRAGGRHNLCFGQPRGVDGLRLLLLCKSGKRRRAGQERLLQISDRSDIQ